MCFSAEADFASAAVIGTIGILTLTKVEHAREVPLAALPLAPHDRRGVPRASRWS